MANSGPMNGPVLTAEQNPLRALADASAALKQSDSVEARTAFARAVLRAGFVSDSADMRALLARAIGEAWTAPRLLFNAAAVLIKNGPAKAHIERAVWAWPKPVSVDEFALAAPPTRTFGDALLIATLQSTFVSDLDLEKFLTTIRRAILEHSMRLETDAPAPEELLTFACALARQCYINEYVWRAEKEEKSLLEKVQRILRQRRDSPLAPLLAAVAASYEPLGEFLPEMPREGWPPQVQAVIRQQVIEPEAIEALRATIPAMTPINDKVSIAVRDQYEENPYPRWSGVPARPAGSLADELKAKFPHANIHSSKAKGEFNVLIAGCGTGQQVPEYSAYPGARTLAIDLSLASLAYASNKANELGLRNVEFAQADILKLDLPEQSFDLIVSTGVLHHMDDPEQGWRKLVALLKPDGYMLTGLYSELARRNIVIARDIIAAKNYRSAPAAIRKFRQDVIGGKLPSLRTVLTAPDFYSLSECRDLLFHVQEQRFTIPRIEAFLRENELEFIGFESTVRIGPDFAAMFSTPEHFSDLSRWHQYERKNPDTFASMYNFWTRKRVEVR